VSELIEKPLNPPSHQPTLETVGDGEVRTATVRVPGSCGELVQGINQDGYFLVSCPVDFHSRVTVTVKRGASAYVANDVDAPEGLSKAGQAARIALDHLQTVGFTACVEVSNPIPKGKGLGSSSADVVGAIAATGLALGRELPPAEIARLALKVEPTDGVMYPGIALFDHRDGAVMESLGPPPPLEIVALDFGGTVDTVDFNRTDRRSLWESVSVDTSRALELVRRGVAGGDPVLLGEGATISAWTGQKVSPKPQLPPVCDFAQAVGAVGVNVAHSGALIGVLLDARQRRGLSVFRKARDAFPQAEMVYHFRLLGGGVRRVTGGA
jgi:L-threonine kinase